MSLTESQWERVDTYIGKHDRAVEPVFVGRKKEIERVDHSIRAARRGDHIGITMCFSGPPGIGKTAFLAESRRRIEANQSAIWVTVQADDINNPDAILCAAAETIAQIPKDRINTSALEKCISFLGKWVSGINLEAGLDVFVFNLKGTIEADKEKRQGQPVKATTGVPWAALGHLRDSVTGKPPFVISVDEAHQLPGSDGQYGTPNKIIRGLHAGGSVPIIPIFAGHVHTPEVVAISISDRFASGQNLFMNNLDKSESRDYVRGVLGHLQADGDFDAIADWIYGESDGFPHHIRGAMSSIAEGMLQANSLRLADLDAKAVEQAFSKGRCDYYAGRMCRRLLRYGKIVSAVLKDAETPGALAYMNIIEKLENGIQGMIESGKAPSDPIDADTLFDLLVGKGAIGRASSNRYSCFIRSLARYADSETHTPHAIFPAQNHRSRQSSAPTMGNPG